MHAQGIIKFYMSLPQRVLSVYEYKVVIWIGQTVKIMASPSSGSERGTEQVSSEREFHEWRNAGELVSGASGKVSGHSLGGMFINWTCCFASMTGKRDLHG